MLMYHKLPKTWLARSWWFLCYPYLIRLLWISLDFEVLITVTVHSYVLAVLNHLNSGITGSNSAQGIAYAQFFCAL